MPHKNLIVSGQNFLIFLFILNALALIAFRLIPVIYIDNNYLYSLAISEILLSAWFLFIDRGYSWAKYLMIIAGIYGFLISYYNAFSIFITNTVFYDGIEITNNSSIKVTSIILVFCGSVYFLSSLLLLFSTKLKIYLSMQKAYLVVKSKKENIINFLDDLLIVVGLIIIIYALSIQQYVTIILLLIGLILLAANKMSKSTKSKKKQNVKKKKKKNMTTDNDSVKLKICPYCHSYQDFDKIKCPNCGFDLMHLKSSDTNKQDNKLHDQETETRYNTDLVDKTKNIRDIENKINYLVNSNFGEMYSLEYKTSNIPEFTSHGLTYKEILIKIASGDAILRKAPGSFDPTTFLLLSFPKEKLKRNLFLVLAYGGPIIGLILAISYSWYFILLYCDCANWVFRSKPATHSAENCRSFRLKPATYSD
ncbi:MAG: hypothetical protein U5R06_04885 [candidate division KSB1 bacterium]|nr:hypothetical protein [candidate division KSB1 bacterium]